MRSRDREALHARNFLQPVHDICIVVDYQSMCHVIPWTKSESLNRYRGCFEQTYDRRARYAVTPLPRGND
jgi:hypothetical protein